MTKRNILLSSEINETSVKDIIEEILKINSEDDEKETNLKDFEREPIYFFINSIGGCVDDGLALVDIIKNSKTPIYTICIGRAMSMGLWVWLSGKKKLIGKNATLCFHGLSINASGKTEYLKQQTKEITRQQEMLIKEIINNSTVEEEILRDYILRKAEWYISADEAIELKLADEYYE